MTHHEDEPTAVQIPAAEPQVTPEPKPVTGCTAPAPQATSSTPTHTIESSIDKARPRGIAADNKRGTGGLDSLGGGRLP